MRAALPPFDPMQLATEADPYSCYAAYRAQDPVHRGIAQNPAQRTCWYLFRYRDVLAALGDPRLGRERPANTGENAAAASPWLLDRDPPFHTAVRAWLQDVFSARLTAPFKPRIEAIARALLAPLRSAGRCGFHTGFAEKLPAAVFAEITGFEGEDAAQVAGAIEELLAPSRSRHRGGLARTLAEDRARTLLSRKLERLLDARRGMPRDDLASALLSAADRHPHPLTHDPVRLLLSMLRSGYEVSVSAIANGIVTLLQEPDLLASLAAQPELLDGTVEETLRYESPLRMVDRWVLADFEIDGRQLQRGERVYLVLAAANHDPEQFPDPETLQPARRDGLQLAFGAATHLCLGATLARRLCRTTFELVARDYAASRIAPPRPRWYPDTNFRILERLHVELAAAP
ncbi:MAG: cytochrome P450 [Gammaproteobacteria bacterium]|nr:cytochrome P450 [Gammaproteobacteria bacterium]MBI5616480.1 cytochrome P450 [Gammaproteobacteria bacterium]